MKGIDGISQCFDVGFLLALLRVAKKGNDLGAQRAIIERLMEIGVLREAAKGEDVTYANLREQVNTILKVKDFNRILNSRLVSSPVLSQ